MHPIILAHGFIGYRNFLFWSMFGGVAETLRKEGFTVLHPATHPTACIKERCRIWVEFIERELGSKQPFHWIGHSMGGLDGRYIASTGGMNLGHRFLTITTLATPHLGSPLADRIPCWLQSGLSSAARCGRFFFSGEQRQFLDRLAENRWDGLQELSPHSIQSQFNLQTPNHPLVQYFSYAGHVEYPHVTLTNFFRRPAWKILQKLEGENDGMVSVQSAQWGEFLGAVSCDHGEMVGLRMIPWIKPKFDSISFFLQLAKNLKEWETNHSPI